MKNKNSKNLIILSDGQLLELEDIELNSFDNVYVSDRGTAFIQSFTKVR